MNLADFAVTKVLTIMEEGAGLDEVERKFRESLHNLHEIMEHVEDDWHEHNTTVKLMATTRSRKRTVER